jgi:hypothetical protein
MCCWQVRGGPTNLLGFWVSKVQASKQLLYLSKSRI